MSASSGYGTGGSGPVGPTIDTITGNVGGPVGPTANNVNLIGAGGVLVSGNPGTSTLTITVPGIATQYDEDVGTAMPALGILNIVGGASTAGVNMNTFGSGNTVEIILNDSLFFPNTNGSGTQGVLFWGGDRFLHNFGGNTFLGALSGNLTVTGDENVGLGAEALNSISSGSGQTAVGTTALFSATTGQNNSAVGIDALFTVTTGSINDALGSNTGWNGTTGLTTGNYNILIGAGDVNMTFNIQSAGYNYTGAESSNILLRHQGVTGESNVMRLGVDGAGNAQQNSTFIAGVYNRTFASPSGVMQIDHNFKVGSSAGTNGQLLIGATGASPLWANLTSVGGSVVITNGANTINLEATGTGAGASAFPADIGTANEVAGVLNIFGGAGTGGTNIRTNGSGNTITIILKDSILMPNTNLSGSEGVIFWGGNTFIHNRGADNTFVGQSAGNLTLTTGSAVDNAFFGADSGNSITIGAENTLIGSTTATNLTTGNNNIALGFGALNNLITGSDNIAIGNFGAGNYTTSESSNIIIGSAGVVGESNVIRIGNQGSGTFQQDTAFMAGIFGSTVGATNAQVFVDSTGKLGTGGGFDGGNLSFMAVITGIEVLGSSASGDTFFGNTKAMTVLYDNFSGSFFPGNGAGTPCSFTAPVDGFYSFDIGVVFTLSSVAVQIKTLFTLNGVDFINQDMPATTGSVSRAAVTSGSVNFQLTAGDVIGFGSSIGGINFTSSGGGFLGGSGTTLDTYRTFVSGVLLRSA